MAVTCPFCGDRFEHLKDHSTSCEGPPILVVNIDPLTVMLGVSEGGYHPTTARHPSELLAGCIQRLYKQFPGRRFQFVQLASSTTADKRLPRGGAVKLQTHTTALLAIADPA